MTRLAAIVVLAAIVLYASTASAQTFLGSAENFAVLAGADVTCTNVDVTGDVGALGTVTRTGCTVGGMVHAGDGVARRAFIDFMTAYANLEANPPACVPLTGPLGGLFLDPGVYCLDATAKTGTLTLDAGGNANAAWTFLVKDGALTGTNFNVVMMNTVNGGQPCNVVWWVRAAATLTDSNFLGTILAGAAITVTRGTFIGHAFATAAVTLTGRAAVPRTTFTACSPGRVPPVEDECKEHHDGDHHGDKDGDHDGHHGDKDHDKDQNCKDHDKDHDKDQTCKDDGKDKGGKDKGGKGKKG